MMLLRERSTEEGVLVSVCDPDVLGETFGSGDVSLTVEPDFYEGEKATAEEVVDSLSQCTVANLVGHESVSTAVEHGFIEEANVLHIDGTVHAQYLRL